MGANGIVSGIRAAARENFLFLAVCCGYALCRLCSEVYAMMPYASLGAEELGKIVGLAVAVVVAYRLNRGKGSVLWGNAPNALAIAGCMLAVSSAGGGVGWVAGLAGFLVGCGTSSAMIQWLEYCGLLPSKRMVIAIATAYLLNTAIAMPVRQFTNAYAACALVFACALGSLLLRLACVHDPRIEERSQATPRDLSAPWRELFPADVIVWIVVTGVAFAMVEHNSGAIIGSLTDNVGRAIPCAVVLVGYLVFNDRFDLRFLYSSILPLIVASLVLIGHDEMGAVVPGLCFSAGAAALRIITYSLVCVRAYQMRVSSFFGCACVMLFNVGSHDVGALLMHVPWVEHNHALVSALLVVTSVTVIVFLIMSEAERMAFVDDLPGLRAAASGEMIEAFADDKGLTPREKSVFLQMAAGKTNAEIADILFISVGAVRSHTSRIYQKTGVGTREELDELVRRLK